MAAQRERLGRGWWPGGRVRRWTACRAPPCTAPWSTAPHSLDEAALGVGPVAVEERKLQPLDLLRFGTGGAQAAVCVGEGMPAGLVRAGRPRAAASCAAEHGLTHCSMYTLHASPSQPAGAVGDCAKQLRAGRGWRCGGVGVGGVAWAALTLSPHSARSAAPQRAPLWLTRTASQGLCCPKRTGCRAWARDQGRCCSEHVEGKGLEGMSAVYARSGAQAAPASRKIAHRPLATSATHLRSAPGREEYCGRGMEEGLAGAGGGGWGCGCGGRRAGHDQPTAWEPAASWCRTAAGCAPSLQVSSWAAHPRRPHLSEVHDLQVGWEQGADAECLDALCEDRLDALCEDQPGAACSEFESQAAAAAVPAHLHW